ncbi:hypothetical protein AMAG_17665 [Allomyces macrogynus ATCC 38327]|uniref:IMS import disulfide relay-system CHCH-CHCH-like Cx9C domain-containing protein n=1 Tax=Allomyces macrogynus (strain ATCC 38327) TaxID=578462 RepID=A0A0L0RWA9_ALLM3|nr:hypothetical protein AMAG_17665 [Allomyces macrogynus ATCC 38327]|eukprot:KNE54385.1 hypothetical protein AMAG_17665 [Allomyces macrogynus ATCC 38327]
MDAAIALVQENCGAELAAFQDCLDRTTHPKNCERARRAMNLCTDAKVPAIRLINEQCGEVNRAFAECLHQNPNDPQQCLPQLRAFHDCSEEVSQRSQSMLASGEERRSA